MPGDPLHKAFRIALELEATGEVFYHALAAGCANRPVADLCRRLARQEADHYRRFAAMLAEGGGAERDLDDQQRRRYRDLIRGHVIPDRRQARRVAEEGTVAEAIEMAIRMENDSVAFYVGLREALGDREGEPLDRIVAEERHHAQELSASRKHLT